MTTATSPCAPAPRDLEAPPPPDLSADLLQLLVHDLRNPLASVLAGLSFVAEGLRDRADLAGELEAIQAAQREGLRLSGMIGDLLLVRRLEVREVERRCAAVPVRDLLDASARATTWQAGAKRIALRVVAPPELVAWIDAALVRRLVDNLVSNALRHAPAGGRIELAAEVDRALLRLAVRNSGLPIPVEARAGLFQKYAALPPREPHAGGLGLYLCRLVAEAHGGRIALAEREGWAVAFEVELPLAGLDRTGAGPGGA